MMPYTNTIVPNIQKPYQNHTGEDPSNCEILQCVELPIYRVSGSLIDIGANLAHHNYEDIEDILRISKSAGLEAIIMTGKDLAGMITTIRPRNSI
jgi:hypothetical protein